MAFYNPNKIEFNPNTMVIEKAGALGRSLYDVYNDNVERKQKQAKLNETNRHNMQIEAHNQNTLNHTIKQDMLERNFKNNEFNTKNEQWNKAHELSKKQLEVQESLKREQLENNRFLRMLTLQDRIDEKQNRQAEDIATANSLDLPNFLDENGALNAITSRIKKIKDSGKDRYIHSQGFIDGTGQNIAGLFGNDNFNQDNDDILRLMSDFIYNEKVRRDTQYNRDMHESLYRLPSALKLDSVNEKNARRLVGDFLSIVDADLNSNYSKLIAQKGIKNPFLNQRINENKNAEIKKLDDIKTMMNDYYGVNKDSEEIKWVDAEDNKATKGIPLNGTKRPIESYNY